MINLERLGLFKATEKLFRFGETTGKRRLVWSSEGLRLNLQNNSKVNNFLRQARRAEPKATADWKEIIKALPDARMIHLDKRLKTADSIKRKFARDFVENPGLTMDESLKRIKDSIRYTIQLPTRSYAKDVDTVIRLAHQRGYVCDIPKGWKNYWDSKMAKPGGYKGINSAWRDPHSGHVIEVQFHTQDSHMANVQSHGIFEQYRVLDDGPFRDALEKQHQGIWDAVLEPPGAGNILKPSESPD
jgi:hypothetical protein